MSRQRAGARATDLVAPAASELLPIGLLRLKALPQPSDEQDGGEASEGPKELVEVVRGEEAHGTAGQNTQKEELNRPTLPQIAHRRRHGVKSVRQVKASGTARLGTDALQRDADAQPGAEARARLQAQATAERYG
jgi:hypothetical protein